MYRHARAATGTAPRQASSHVSNLEWRGCWPPTEADVSSSISDISGFEYISRSISRIVSPALIRLSNRSPPDQSKSSVLDFCQEILAPTASVPCWYAPRELWLRQDVLATSNLLADFLIQALLNVREYGLPCLHQLLLTWGDVSRRSRQMVLTVAHSVTQTDVRIRSSNRITRAVLFIAKDQLICLAP